MAIQTKRLAGTFVAELSGINLADDHDAATIAAVKALWWEHQILVFKDQHIDEPDLVRFSAKLGPLEIHLRREYLSPDNPEILFISNILDNGRPIGILSDNEVGWHYDQIYLPKPAVGSLLYAVVLPGAEGATSFADMRAAYAALPQNIKDRIDGKRAIQSYEAFNKVYSVPTNKEQKKKSADIDQPLVRTHPYNGHQALYICPGMTTEIVGMDKAESDDLLDYLFEWCLRDEFVYQHDWSLGDAILWDNASTMHRREPFDPNEQRLMKRTTILPEPALAVPV